MSAKLPTIPSVLVVLTVFFIICMPFGLTASTWSAWAQNAQKDILTPEEISWLKDHPVIRLAPERGYAPFIFKDTDGQLKGMSIDYMNLLEKNLGVQFKLLESNNLASILEQARLREVDLVSSLMKTPERSEYMLFTTPYITIPAVVIVRKDYEGQISLDQMMAYKIAVGKGYAVQSYLREHYPGLPLIPVDDDMTCLRMVSFGDVDAAVVDLASASHIIGTLKITNLHVATTVDFNYELSLASRKDWPVLSQIIEKGMSRISSEQRNAIYSRWVGLSGASGYTAQTIWIAAALILGAVLVVTAIAILWNRSLKAKVKQRTEQLRIELAERRRMEASLRRSEEKYRLLVENQTDLVVRVDAEGRFQFVNPAYCELFGKTEEELLGNSFMPMVHEDDRDSAAKAIESLFAPPYSCYLEQWVQANIGWQWLAWSNRSILDDCGKVVAIVGVGRNIPNKK
jgi:PAS domain S-box-containing protein